MDWTHRSGKWESGAFTIELAAPGSWVLTRASVEDDSQVHTGQEWTSGSLRRLKAQAEELASEPDLARRRKQPLIVMAISLFVFLNALSLSGPIAVLVVIASAMTLIYGLIRGVDQLIVSSPWHLISEIRQ